MCVPFGGVCYDSKNNSFEYIKFLNVLFSSEGMNSSINSYDKEKEVTTSRGIWRPYRREVRLPEILKNTHRVNQSLRKTNGSRLRN